MKFTWGDMNKCLHNPEEPPRTDTMSLMFHLRNQCIYWAYLESMGEVLQNQSSLTIQESHPSMDDYFR